MDDLEGEICDEEVRECGLWNDILSTDLDGEEVLLLNIRDYRISGVAHDLACLICRDGVGKVSEALFYVCFALIFSVYNYVLSVAVFGLDFVPLHLGLL